MGEIICFDSITIDIRRVNLQTLQSVVQDIGRTTVYKGKKGVIREQCQYLEEVIEALIWRFPYDQAALSRFGILLATIWGSILETILG